jgi:predicted ATPase/DNA-binding SARP family transcriptional activator
LSNKLEVKLLGRFEVSRDGKPIAITSRPAQSLFAYLILSAGTSHRREKLAGLFWPDSLEETARDNLRHALWRVRKALESASSVRFLHADDLGIGFEKSSDYWLDAADLEKLSENASADELMAVLSEYQGELLPGFYDEWVALEREHLASIFEHHMARLMSLLQTENRWLDILEWSEHWIQLGQKPEPAYRALMSAHAAKGDMSKVAATYERCVKSLHEFGMEPSEQTKEVYENLKARKEYRKPIPVSTKFIAKGISSNVPVPLTSFIGREKELKQIASLLSASRLVTLTGPGGVGKTRLAIQTAHDSIRKFKDGVFWVGLVGLSDENLIPQEIAQSFNVREIPNEPLIETLKTYLKPRELLIILDNCEHMIRACAEYAEQLLAACPKLKILATSIESLGLFNENTWQVPSLPLPEMKEAPTLKELYEFASIELFDERAGNAKSGFKLDERNAASVAQICRRLDGIPLAIELAAARIKVLSVDEIAARIDDRFSLLTAGSRTAIPRHQTLRATIDWSYDLLTEPERSLLRRLSVFAGGFTLEAAEAVCSQGMKQNDILDLLGRLVDKSLVIVESDSDVDETRYRLLETIRQYALEKLVEAGEASVIRDRHLDFYLSLAEESEPHLFGHESILWINRLDKELDNIRAAMEWSTNSGKAVAALRIAGSFVYFYFWYTHGNLLSELQHRIQLALSRPEAMERTLARAKALNALGFMNWADTYPTDRRPELEEALSIGRELGDPWNTAAALLYLGLLASMQGNYVEARSLLEQSLEISRTMGPDGKVVLSWTLTFLGDVALHQSESKEARSFFEETVAILREIGDKNFLAYSLRRLGLLAWRQKDYRKAIALCKESLSINRELGDPRGVLACLAGFADIAVVQGKFARAARLMAAVETQLAAMGMRLLPVDKLEYERNLAHLRENMDEKALAKFWAKGKAMPLEELTAFALQET